MDTNGASKCDVMAPFRMARQYKTSMMLPREDTTLLRENPLMGCSVSPLPLPSPLFTSPSKGKMGGMLRAPQPDPPKHKQIDGGWGDRVARVDRVVTGHHQSNAPSRSKMSATNRRTQGNLGMR